MGAVCCSLPWRGTKVDTQDVAGARVVVVCGLPVHNIVLILLLNFSDELFRDADSLLPAIKESVLGIGGIDVSYVLVDVPGRIESINPWSRCPAG